MLCVATGLFGLFFFLTLFIQTVLGYSAVRSGIAYLPFAVGTVTASALAARLVAAGRPPAADRGRHGHDRGRDVLVLPADRALRLPQPAARPAARDLARTWPGVRPAVPRRPAQGRRAGLRRRLQPAQRRPAGRRRDRARAARHRRLDDRRRQRQDPARALGGGRDGRHRTPACKHLPSRPGGRLFPRVPCLRRDRAARPAHRARHHPGPPPGSRRRRARAANGGTATGGAAARDGAARDGAARDGAARDGAARARGTRARAAGRGPGRSGRGDPPVPGSASRQQKGNRNERRAARGPRSRPAAGILPS